MPLLLSLNVFPDISRKANPSTIPATPDCSHPVNRLSLIDTRPGFSVRIVTQPLCADRVSCPPQRTSTCSRVVPESTWAPRTSPFQDAGVGSGSTDVKTMGASAVPTATSFPGWLSPTRSQSLALNCSFTPASIVSVAPPRTSTRSART